MGTTTSLQGEETARKAKGVGWEGGNEEGWMEEINYTSTLASYNKWKCCSTGFAFCIIN